MCCLFCFITDQQLDATACEIHTDESSMKSQIFKAPTLSILKKNVEIHIQYLAVYIFNFTLQFGFLYLPFSNQHLQFMHIYNQQSGLEDLSIILL